MDLMAFVPNVTPMPNLQHTPCVQHICKAPKEEDPLVKMMPGRSVWSRLQRWFLGTRLPSRRHPLVKWYLRSSKAIDYEIGRQLEFYPYMIHPFSSFRVFWESAMTLFIVATLFITPVFLAFYFDEYKKWYVINHVIDAVLICDVIIWFFTGYYDRRTQLIILDPRIVASKYLRGFFIVDVLPILPLEFLAVISESMWYLTSLNVLKILRLRTVIVYSRRLYHMHRVNFHLYKMAEMGIIIAICVHWAASLEYYLPLMVAKVAGQDARSWIRSSYMARRKTRLGTYLTCVNRAIIALTSSAHYLDMTAPADILYNLLLTILGFLGYVYLLGALYLSINSQRVRSSARLVNMTSHQFDNLTMAFHSASKRHLQLIQQLQQYTRHKELSHTLQRRLLVYYDYRNRKGFERNKRIVNHVSPHLREELLSHDYTTLLNNVQLLENLPPTLMTQFAGALRLEIFMTNDVLVKAGTRDDALYLIISGTVAVCDNMEKEVCHLEDGAYFGEVAIEDERKRIATVLAADNCEVCILLRPDFQRILTPFPNLSNHLQNVALAHLKQTLSLEEMCELNSSKINISSIKIKRRDRIDV